MKEFLFDGIVIKTNQEDCTRECAEKYLTYINEHKEDKDAKIKSAKVIIDGSTEDVDIIVDYVQDKPKFERIRRITGYLTGSLDTWNAAKQAEEKARVKHM